jgi:hypothetical protein
VSQLGPQPPARGLTDAHDLFVIGILVYLLKGQWHLDTSQVSLLNSITLASGAITSACAPDYTFLLISRAIPGISIGGFPVSATIMSEYSGKNTRGRQPVLAGTGSRRARQRHLHAGDIGPHPQRDDRRRDVHHLVRDQDGRVRRRLPVP